MYQIIYIKVKKRNERKEYKIKISPEKKPLISIGYNF